MRDIPGQHLSKKGIELARRVGATLGRFDVVITSNVTRAIETATEMGYTVDEQIELLGDLIDVEREVDWRAGCAAFAAAAKRGGSTAKAAAAHAELMRSIAARLPEGGRALVVSHGGMIEVGVVGLLPDYDYSSWGESCGYCEGVRLTFEGGECVSAELLRLPNGVRAS